MGWATDLENPSESLTVDIYSNGTRWKTIAADKPRPDIAAVLGTERGFGFIEDVPVGNVEICFGGSLTRIPSSVPSINKHRFDPNIEMGLRLIPVPPPNMAAYVSGQPGDVDIVSRAYRRTAFSVAADILNEVGDAGIDIVSPHTLIDIGCGCGRVTSAIYAMSQSIECSGFDIWSEGIEWAASESSKPDLQFELLGAGSPEYNGSSKIHIPRADGSADIVISTSLFTHLDPQTADHYLAETHRLLRPNGVAYHTFLFREDSDDAATALANRNEMEIDKQEHVTLLRKGDYLDSYFNREEILRMFARQNLEVIKARRGNWRGDAIQAVDSGYQDLIVARKVA